MLLAFLWSSELSVLPPRQILTLPEFGSDAFPKPGARRTIPVESPDGR